VETIDSVVLGRFADSIGNVSTGGENRKTRNEDIANAFSNFGILQKNRGKQIWSNPKLYKGNTKKIIT
jgi:hypothetical protein